MTHTCSSGWWYTYPSEKYEFVSWDYYPQYDGKVIKFIKIPWFQTTNQSYIFRHTHIMFECVFFRLVLQNPGAQIWIQIPAAIEVLFPIIRLSCKASWVWTKGNSISQETNGNHGFEHTSVDHLENRSVCWSTTFELIPNHFRTCPLYHVCAGSCAAFCG